MLISHRPHSLAAGISNQSAIKQHPDNSMGQPPDRYTSSLRFGTSAEYVTPQFDKISLAKLTRDVHEIIQYQEDLVEKVNLLTEIAAKPAMNGGLEIDDQEKASDLFNKEIVPTVLSALQAQAEYVKENPTDTQAKEKFEQMKKAVRSCKKPFPNETLPFFVILNDISKPALQLHQLSQYIRRQKNPELLHKINEKIKEVGLDLSDEQKNNLVQTLNYEPTAPVDDKAITELLKGFELSSIQVKMVKALLSQPLKADQQIILNKLIEHRDNTIKTNQIDQLCMSPGLMAQVNAVTEVSLSPVALSVALEKALKRDLRTAEKATIKAYMNAADLLRKRQAQISRDFTRIAVSANIDAWDRPVLEAVFQQQPFFELHGMFLNRMKSSFQKTVKNDIALLQHPMSQEEQDQLLAYHAFLKPVEGLLKDTEQPISEKIKQLLTFNTNITLYEESYGIRNGFFRLVVAPQILQLMNQKSLEKTGFGEEFQTLKRQIMESSAWQQGLFADNKLVCDLLLNKEQNRLSDVALFNFLNF